MADTIAVTPPAPVTVAVITGVPASTLVLPSMFVAQMTNSCEIMPETDYSCDNKIENIILQPYQPSAINTNYTWGITANSTAIAATGTTSTVQGTGYAPIGFSLIPNVLFMTDSYFKLLLAPNGLIGPANFTFDSQLSHAPFGLNNYSLASGLNNETGFNLKRALMSAVLEYKHVSESELSVTHLMEICKLSLSCSNLAGIKGRINSLKFEDVVKTLYSNGEIKKAAASDASMDRGHANNQAFVHLLMHVDLAIGDADIRLHIQVPFSVALYGYINAV